MSKTSTFTGKPGARMEDGGQRIDWESVKKKPENEIKK